MIADCSQLMLSLQTGGGSIHLVVVEHQAGELAAYTIDVFDVN